jgi:hypothetical protein
MGVGVRRSSRRNAESCWPAVVRGVSASGLTVRNTGPRPGSITATTTLDLLGWSSTIPSMGAPAPDTVTSSFGLAIVDAQLM